MKKWEKKFIRKISKTWCTILYKYILYFFHYSSLKTKLKDGFIYLRYESGRTASQKYAKQKFSFSLPLPELRFLYFLLMWEVNNVSTLPFYFLILSKSLDVLLAHLDGRPVANKCSWQKFNAPQCDAIRFQWTRTFTVHLTPESKTVIGSFCMQRQCNNNRYIKHRRNSQSSRKQ